MGTKKLTVVDLFSGAGGFSLAAQNLGMQISAAIEFDEESCKTYKKNLVKNKKTHLYNEDILDLKPETVLKDAKLEQGELDLLVGGPPCQGFSTHRINGQGIDDPRNKLLIRYFDYLSALSPKVFLVENVPGLLWDRHKFYLSKFMKLAKDSGYRVFEPEVVNAKDYGLPQNRRRVFILGIREDLNQNDITWPPKPTHFDPKVGTPHWIPASSVFEKPPQRVIKSLEKLIGEDQTGNLPYGEPIKSLDEDPCSINMQHSEDLKARFQATPVNGSREDTPFRLKCHPEGYKGHKDVYGRVKFHMPGPTMTTGCNNPSKGRFLHPWKNHGISIRHAARFQGFPDSFFFEGGSMSQARQVGNAVPIKLGEIMIKEALKCIERQSLAKESKATKQKTA